MSRLDDPDPEALRELASFSVYEGRFNEHSPLCREWVNGRESIQWQDHSVTVVEYLPGLPRRRIFLPPLRGMAALLELRKRPDDPVERRRREMNDEETLIDLGMIQRGPGGLTKRTVANYSVTEGWGRSDLAPLLTPLESLAASFREELDDRTGNAPTRGTEP